MRDRGSDNFVERLRRVIALPPTLRIAALGEALSIADEAQSRQLAPELIFLADPAVNATVWERFSPARRATRADAALTALVRCWHAIPLEQRGTALNVGRGRWGRVVELAVTDQSAVSRMSVAEMAPQADDPAMAIAVAGLILDREAPVAAAAEESLVRLAMRALQSEGSLIDLLSEHAAPVGAATRDALAEALAETIRLYEEHRRRDVALAVILLGDGGKGPGASQLRAWIAGLEDGGHGALRLCLRRTDWPIARLRALQWVAYPSLSKVCVQRLGAAGTIADHEMVLRNWHLTLRPARAALLEGVKEKTGGPLPNAAACAALTPAARAGLPGWSSVIGASFASRRGTLECLLTDIHHLTRHRAVRALPGSALADWCFDADERVARAAYLRKAPNAHVDAEALMRSPHEVIRNWAELESRPHHRMLSLRRVCATAPDRAAATLTRAMESDDAATALDALLLARGLHLAPTLADPIVKLAGSPPGVGTAALRVAATAAALTGEVPGERAERAVADALQHRDARVRANAVEAAARRASRWPGGASLEAVFELKHDPHHRVRGNAVRAGMSAPSLRGQATQELLAMLRDEKASHRLAGAWVAARCAPKLIAVQEVVSAIRALARADADPRVRARAATAGLALGGGDAGPSLRLITGQDELEQEVA